MTIPIWSKDETWLNSEPLTSDDYKGKIVLVDFWDYTCVNCIRTLPYIKAWWNRYKDDRFLLIGVHTPEFPFAAKVENVEKAVKHFGLTYPIVLDNEYRIWNGFDNHYWPAKYLFDQNGILRHQHFGEGSYEETEETIQTLLKTVGLKDVPEPMKPIRETDMPGAVCYRVTPELYCGYLRGLIGNKEGYNPDGSVTYEEPAKLDNDRFYAVGKFENGDWHLRHVGGNGSIIIRYKATELNAVLARGDKAIRVIVKQDGAFLEKESAGVDVKIDDDGKSYIVVDDARMYNIAVNETVDYRTLRMNIEEPGFEIYAFTFTTSCVRTS